MQFKPAVKHVLNNYVTFSGRALRSEYWYWVLFTLIVSVVLSIIDSILGLEILASLFSIATLLPSVAVGARRLHDIDRSGWWLLIGLIPLLHLIVPSETIGELRMVIMLVSLVGSIVLIYWFCQKGTDGPNRFGAAAPTA